MDYIDIIKLVSNLVCFCGSCRYTSIKLSLRSAAHLGSPFTQRRGAAEVCRGCCPAMMSSQSPHCPDSPVHTQSHPFSHPSAAYLSPSLPLWPQLFSRSSPGVRYSGKVTASRLWALLCVQLYQSLTATMVHSSWICRFLLLVLLSLMVTFVHTGKPPLQSGSDFFLICNSVISV